MFIEEADDGSRAMISPEKLPSREPFLLNTYSGMTIEEILADAGIEKESVYYIISPERYFRSRIHFPFTDRQKIDGVIDYEVRDSLPLQDTDCVTDFYLVGNEAQAFSVEREKMRALLQSFGRYRENLRAVIPRDVALFFGMHAFIEEDGYILLQLENRSVYIQYVVERRIVNGRLVSFGEDAEITIDGLRQRVLPHLIMCAKLSGNPFVWVNRTSSANEKLCEQTEGLLEELNIPFSPVRVKNIDNYYPDIKSFDHCALSLFGAVRAASSPLMQVNLLKNEFKPRAKGYVSVREFTLVGVLLIFLFALGTVSLIFDIGFRKQQVAALKGRIEEIGKNTFGSAVADETDARKRVSEVQERVKVLEESTDRHLSSLKLLKELSLYFPGDVVIEYTDIIIEREHIKLSGNVRSFSDIDKITEDLVMSDYFTAVEVTNTGTTGSTGGFTVTFALDITVSQEQMGGL